MATYPSKILQTMRIGQGFDIHRLEPNRPFKLGGVLLDWPLGPVGHSDGDALLHAITDALLGAAGLGDIGEWFSPNDSRWAGADSSDLLKTVFEKITQDGWKIANLDCTILLEKPKLASYKPQIKSRLSELLDLSINQISVKAKTMEQLGPIGEGQAVAAMASVLLTSLK